MAEVKSAFAEALEQTMDDALDDCARANAQALFCTRYGEQPTDEQVSRCRRLLELGWLGISADPEDP